MPMPVSETRRWTVTPASLRSSTLMRAMISPTSVNLIAFPTRFTSTWRSRPTSPTRMSGTSGSISRVRLRLFSCAHWQSIFRVSPMAPRTSKVTSSRSSLPASIFAKSRMPLMTLSSVSAEVRTISRWSRTAGGSSAASASAVIPMIPFIGVRISWLMTARNSLLARLAVSAASLARRRSSSACLRSVMLWAIDRDQHAEGAAEGPCGIVPVEALGTLVPAGDDARDGLADDRVVGELEHLAGLSVDIGTAGVAVSNDAVDSRLEPAGEEAQQSQDIHAQLCTRHASRESARPSPRGPPKTSNYICGGGRIAQIRDPRPLGFAVPPASPVHREGANQRRPHKARVDGTRTYQKYKS